MALRHVGAIGTPRRFDFELDQLAEQIHPHAWRHPGL